MSPDRMKLTLVGAGPGDPDLITLKGVKALRSADVVLYDALISTELLEYAAGAEKIFVGKRKGFHRYSQDEINALIVEKALEHQHVVRLKGGDPFVFGRGSEEIDYAHSFGIPTDVIPGISSSIAVPSSIGIPLTKRGISESFWVITGCNSDRQLSTDVELAARSSATIVILMGVHKLPQIVKLFQGLGKSDLPVAVIQNGTMKNENYGIGTVDDILDTVQKKNISSPAIILLGEVVRDQAGAKAAFSELSYHKAS